jgi:chromodomain-helicase-DNA-binding protein 1
MQVSITTEIPAFKFQGQALRTASPEALMNLALAATTLRLGLYGLLPLAPSVWCVLPIELLHGASFALGWGAATAGSSRLAPPHLAATMQVRVCVLGMTWDAR